MLDYLPQNIATYGGDVDGVIRFIWNLTLGWLVACELLLVFFIWRFRRRDGGRAAWMPAQSWKGMSWILVPAAVVTVCDLVIEARSAPVWEEIKMEIPEHPDLLVRITARQFAWDFTYAGEDGVLGTEDDFQTVSALHVPRDAVVRFELESHDVLHSFWVPVLRLKQDAVPGRTIAGWFQATETGQFEIACAEICGPSHTAMRAVLTVDSPEAFRLWSQTIAAQQSS